MVPVLSEAKELLPEDTMYYVYIVTNKSNKVLYTGMTNNLPRRVYEHKLKIRKCFTNLYNADKLVYFEECKSLGDALIREKQIKGWLRKKKLDLINSINPKWIDLTLEISERFQIEVLRFAQE